MKTGILIEELKERMAHNLSMDDLTSNIENSIKEK